MITARWLFAHLKFEPYMKRVNQYQFYQAGIAIHPMTVLKDGVTVQDAWYPCYHAQQWLDFLINENLTPLVTCKSAAIKLRAAVAGVVPDFSKTSDTADLSKELQPYTTWSIRSLATEFETVFAAELETIDTYYISQKGIYSTNLLIEQAEQTFTPQVQSELSAQAIIDIRQAGKCLAFDLDTACGFHIIRATETLIHKYYVSVTGTSPKRKDRNWGAYVRNLNTHRKNNSDSKADPKLINLIDQIREHYRNPVVHPEEPLTPDEAQSLFSICQAVIITFAGAIKELSGHSVLSMKAI